jgi:hypothetical protein
MNRTLLDRHESTRWRTSLVALAAALLAPIHVEADHAGCVASPAAPRCSYKATGAHRCTGHTDGTWEAYVMRPIQVGDREELRKVVLAGHEGTVVGPAGDVAAFPDEVVTLVINADGWGDTADVPGGLVSCGHAAGHSPADSASVANASATSSFGDVPLQPGAPIIDQSGLAAYTDAYCTLNFVFRDRDEGQREEERRTYIGTSGHCAPGVGQEVAAPQIGFFGTVVFRVFWEPNQANDFALIEVRRDKLGYVSPVMRGYGAAPSGYTTSDQTNAGDLLVTHGWPAGVDTGATTRYGALALDYPTHYYSVEPIVLDTGAPVVRLLDGKAVGISNEIGVTVAGLTVEHIFVLLQNSGFDVTLAE